MSHKDFLGTPLMIGDAVVIADPGYTSLSLKYVIGFTPMMIKLSHKKDEKNGINKSSCQVVKLQQ